MGRVLVDSFVENLIVQVCKQLFWLLWFVKLYIYSSVKLEKPLISMTSPHAMVIYRPDKISVTQGSSFSVTCSIHSTYPNGYFYLTKSNMNFTETKLAFGHSIFYLAYFDFPAIENNHEGEYSCVYSVNISSMTFSSVPSKSLLVTVVSGKTQRTLLILSCISALVIATFLLR